ncbi:hypothetical protein Thimo_3565 [Thioflavicoccus mobilis 8321]|uniref:L,D-TPase catalytic domain-containing protein n=2 Tax=Thioflavicoccus mobilis TaxID=80679 RepID=L0H2E6_9GAMM|nr:hypothetical protein Thimo_3565 [Thioflavicoccus mobilis 8321]
MSPTAKLVIVALPILAGAVAGCAHQETLAERPPEESMTVAAGEHAEPNRTPAAPEEDVRYALPPAQERSLTINVGSQTFEYVEDGGVVARGPISSGSPEHPTPTGEFQVLSKDADKRSGSYTNAFDQPTPMPYSLQFYGPYFIHEGWLPGYAASHGCVRLRYEDARLIFHRIRVGDPVHVRHDGVARAASASSSSFSVF